MGDLMRRIVIINILLLAWVILQSQPIIEFETLRHDYGEIKEEAGPHEFNFKFINAGDEVFQLTNVKPG